MRRRSRLAGSPEEHAKAEAGAASDASRRAAAVHRDVEKGKCASAATELVMAAQAVGEARANRAWLPRATGKGAYENPLARVSSELLSARGAFNLKCLVGPGLDGLKRRRRRSRK